MICAWSGTLVEMTGDTNDWEITKSVNNKVDLDILQRVSSFVASVANGKYGDSDRYEGRSAIYAPSILCR
jgi:hypothetical protein